MQIPLSLSQWDHLRYQWCYVSVAIIAHRKECMDERHATFQYINMDHLSSNKSNRLSLFNRGCFTSSDDVLFHCCHRKQMCIVHRDQWIGPDGDLIDNFVLVGEFGTEINDLATGCATDSYDNRTSTSVTLYAGKTYTLQVSTVFNESDCFSLWIDFNANFQFESSERVASVLMVGTSNNDVSVVVPTISGGAAIGLRWMRATMVHFAYPNPCHALTNHGETHDYTANIIEFE